MCSKNLLPPRKSRCTRYGYTCFYFYLDRLFLPAYMRWAKNSRSAAMVAVVWATLGPPMVLRVAMQV